MLRFTVELLIYCSVAFFAGCWLHKHCPWFKEKLDKLIAWMLSYWKTNS